ncbi:hypothetical+protein [Methylocapsa aurea]|jgi:hypothetical protein
MTDEEHAILIFEMDGLLADEQAQTLQEAGDRACSPRVGVTAYEA